MFKTMHFWPLEVDLRWNRFWLRPVSGRGRKHGWMVRGRRIASWTLTNGGHWMLVIGPMLIASDLEPR